MLYGVFSVYFVGRVILVVILEFVVVETGSGIFYFFFLKFIKI